MEQEAWRETRAQSDVIQTHDFVPCDASSYNPVFAATSAPTVSVVIEEVEHEH